MNKMATGALALILLAGTAGCSSATTPPAATNPATSAPVASTPAPPPDNTTAGQKNALRAAESYLQTMAFSRAGLIKQLEFSKYSTEDATYAVDHVKVDWTEQAARSAKSYLESQPFSHDGLVKQLEFSGFTPDEAEQGTAAAGL